MFERKLSSLESRKQLLIVESEINRILLVRDAQALARDIHEAAQPLKNLGALAASAIGLLGAFKAFRGRKSGAESPHPSWLSALRHGFALWTSLRRDQD